MLFLALLLSWSVIVTDTMTEVGHTAVCLTKEELRPAHQAEGLLWGWNRNGERTELDLGYSVEGVAPEHRQICIEAIRRWGNPEYGIRIHLTPRPAGSPKTIVFIEEPDDTSLLAQAEFPWTGGPSSRIRINTRADWATYDLLSVLIHEVGHALGFSHVNDPDSVMRPFYTGQRRLGWSDIVRASQLYLTRPWPGTLMGKN